MASDRNQPCPCESGLKAKKCHGDPVIVEACKKAANLMFLHLITPKRLKAGLIDQDEYERIMSTVGTTLIEMVTGKDDTPEVKRDITDLQSGLVKCESCGRMIPAGTKCMKCEGKHEQAGESSVVLS